MHPIYTHQSCEQQVVNESNVGLSKIFLKLENSIMIGNQFK